MAGVGEAGLGYIVAAAAVASAATSVYSATQGAPKPPKPPALPTEALQKAPDTGALDAQRQRRAVLAGAKGTILTGPQGLGTTGTGAPQRSTLLGM